MPPDVGDQINLDGLGSSAPTTEDPGKLADDAAEAARAGDGLKADKLFAAADAGLDADLAGRGASGDARRRADGSAERVAMAALRSGRSGAALSTLEKLSSLERLPLLFKFAGLQVRAGGDAQAFLAAIGTAFAAEPSLPRVEADEIRSLYAALPTVSSATAQVGAWRDGLPSTPAQPLPRTTGPTLPPDDLSNHLKDVFVASAIAMPSVATTSRALAEARHGQVVQAIADAKTLKPTLREIAILETARDFLKALPPEVMAARAPLLGPKVLAEENDVSVAAVDALLLAIEMTAASAKDFSGARAARAAVGAGSPFEGYAAAILAQGAAGAALPREALTDIEAVKDPVARFAVWRGIAAILPSP